MKRPAAVASKRPASSVRKKPAAAGTVKAKKTDPTPSRKAGSSEGRKDLGDLARKDLVFYEVPAGRNCFSIVRGYKSAREGYFFEHLAFNKFADVDKVVPKKAKKQKVPPDGWIREFFFDAAKQPVQADLSNLPACASGTAYRIEDNGGMPFVCYVRPDAVSVLRIPKDRYVDEDAGMDTFEQMRLCYQEEVITVNDPLKAWIGLDDEAEEHGNSILVHISDGSPEKVCTATLEQDDESIQVTCSNMAGVALCSKTFTTADHVSELLALGKESLSSVFMCCFDSSGHEVPCDRPLSACTKLVLRDVTQKYLYIGDEIYKFDLSEVVVAYYSRLGNNRVPYPVGLTEKSALFMLDRISVPQIDLVNAVPKENGEPDWSDAYPAFYDAEDAGKISRTSFANWEEVCQRL
eukprot:TRINITY_DN22695_c0_g1_i9.p1 TRINITY_DN22695_c0_g1~~TRINITY_DN22695_c0_g1_i9.p1  ORF type:complete len:407 (+),score=58.42 TRINITY_DN22695_c0_g1_i9:106-1326(+)